jgi:DNA mismatch endonuclease (patch repair protein)
MSRIRGKDTGPELALAAVLACRGLEWESHARDLPGRPDFVFRSAKVAVFVDGDFWHGRNFGQWRHKLSEKWEAKISATRRRDRLNDRALREQGWQSVRISEHQIETSVARCAGRIFRAISRASVDESREIGVDPTSDTRQTVGFTGGGAVNADQGT